MVANDFYYISFIARQVSMETTGQTSITTAKDYISTPKQRYHLFSFSNILKLNNRYTDSCFVACVSKNKLRDE